MKRTTLVSLVLMIPVLLGGCAVDALTWGLTGFGMLSDQYRPDYGSKPDRRCASRRTWPSARMGPMCSLTARSPISRAVGRSRGPLEMSERRQRRSGP